jgi:hypothetical protein
MAHYNLGISYLANSNRKGALEQYRILQSLDENRASKLYAEINK